MSSRQPPPSQILAVGEPVGRVVEGVGRVAEEICQRILVEVGTEGEVGQLFERGQTMLIAHRQSGFFKLVPGAFLPIL